MLTYNMVWETIPESQKTITAELCFSTSQLWMQISRST